MEQYILTLIAADVGFIPHPSQVEAFFAMLTKSHHFRIIADQSCQQGLRITKPSGRFRSPTNLFTGDTLPISIPVLDHVKIDRIVDIARAVEGLRNYNLLASGEWTAEKRPLVLLTTDKVPYADSYLCQASCHVRPELVSTSCWNKFLSPNGPSVPPFGEACKDESRVGIFSHPWTGNLIQVPDAGCSRFWIEFEFGKFLLPKMSDSLDVLQPTMIAEIEQCFGTRLTQGWRFN